MPLNLNWPEVVKFADLALLAAVREAAGKGAVIGVSLDLHANLHPGMTALAQIFAAYRSYPHVDMRATGVRAARMMARRLAGPARPLHAQRVPFLLPLKQITSL